MPEFKILPEECCNNCILYSVLGGGGHYCTLLHSLPLVRIKRPEDHCDKWTGATTVQMPEKTRVPRNMLTTDTRCADCANYVTFRTPKSSKHRGKHIRVCMEAKDKEGLMPPADHSCDKHTPRAVVERTVERPLRQLLLDDV